MISGIIPPFTLSGSSSWMGVSLELSASTHLPETGFSIKRPPARAPGASMVDLSRVDLNLFVVFNAIYTERGVTRASAVLKLSQSAISHSLAKLRDLVGDPLFTRVGNSISPTPVAEQLIGPVRRALAEIQGSLFQLRTLPFEEAPLDFKIGMDSLLESSAMPTLMAAIAQCASDVRISAVNHSRTTFQERLASKTLDAVVDDLLPHSLTINHRFLQAGKMVVIARNGHPAVINGRITLQDYLDQDHVTANASSEDQTIDYELSRAGLQRRVKMRCQHHWTASKVTCSSNMLLTMPERASRAVHEVSGNQIIAFPIDISAPDLMLYWSANLEDDPSNRWLRERIYESFQVDD